MGRVTFIGSDRLERKTEIRSERGTSLLSLAVQHGVPLPCRCREGECGTCAVKVAPQRGWIARTRLTWKEKCTLFAAGKISRKELTADLLPDHPPLWRLACEYRIADEDIVVAF